jgi:hypothetical protein
LTSLGAHAGRWGDPLPFDRLGDVDEGEDPLAGAACRPFTAASTVSMFSSIS